MRLSFRSLCLTFAWVAGLFSGHAALSADPVAPADKPIQIPRIADDSGDWATQAHQVPVLNPADDTPGSEAQLAFAWTPTALLVQVKSNDATPFEADKELWTGDSLELFISSSPGSDDRLQFLFSAGRAPEHAEPRWKVYPMGSTNPGKTTAAPEVHAKSDAKGYVMTISVPWSNLTHAPKPGDVIGLQAYVNDAQGNGIISHSTWFPGRGAMADARQMQRVQLADQADPPEIAAAQLQPKGLRDLLVQVVAPAELAGKNITVWCSGKQAATGALTSGATESNAMILLPRDLAETPKAQVFVTVDGKPVPTALSVPDLAARRINFIRNLPMGANRPIFAGNSFPKIDFSNKEVVQDAIGEYTLHTRFFDAGWNEITAPGAPGRYGARVEFKSKDGTFTDHITLFKTAQPYFPAKDPYDVTVQFPAAFGLPAEIGEKEPWNISNWTGTILKNNERTDNTGAMLVAALHDIAADPARLHGFDVWMIDDAWWSELEKRLGEDQEYPHLTHVPDDYDKGEKPWPLILYLHGSGERGNDVDRLKGAGPLGFILQGHAIPAIIVVPQCPEHEWWDAGRLMHLIDETSAKYRIDPKRIYVTGLSMGGYGTWNLAGSYPGKIAAIAPVAGGGNPALAERLGKMPAWVFHGSEDDVVPTRYSIDLVHAMEKLGAPVKLTLYPGIGHGGWELTYENPDLYTWLLKQSK